MQAMARYLPNRVSDRVRGRDRGRGRVTSAWY